MTKFDLYFGRATKDGHLISPGQFHQFLQDKVDPEFRSGYTLTSAEGIWQGQSEPSYILTVIAPEEKEQALANIARAYNRRFHQEAVYMTQQPLFSAGLITAKDEIPIWQNAPLAVGLTQELPLT